MLQKHITYIIHVYSDGSTDVITVDQPQPQPQPVVQQQQRKTQPKKPACAPPQTRGLNFKPERPCEHHGVTYPSMSAASVVENVNRYWVNKWCNEESNGWRWL